MKLIGKGTKRIAQWLLCLAVVLTTINLPTFQAEVKAEEAEEGSATFKVGSSETPITLSWSELKDSDNGEKYQYDASAIKDTSIGSIAFLNCSGLLNITIPKGVTRIGANAFSGCSSLTSITIPEGVTNIERYAFMSCAFTNITIPDSVTSIGDYTFYGCSNLFRITIPRNVTNIGVGMFAECTNINKLVVDANNVTYTSRDEQGMECNAIINRETKTIIAGIKTTVIPNGVKTIGPSSFLRTTLSSITIPDSVTSIGNRAFAKCKNLTSINIPDSVTSIGSEAFEGCSNLKEITIANPDVVLGRLCFWICDSLKSIKVSCKNPNAGEGNASYWEELKVSNYQDKVILMHDYLTEDAEYHKCKECNATETHNFDDNCTCICGAANHNFVGRTCATCGAPLSCAPGNHSFKPISIEKHECSICNTEAEHDYGVDHICTDCGQEDCRATGTHNFGDNCTCICGAADHNFSADCDDTCNNCGYERTVSGKHDFSDGATKCKVCDLCRSVDETGKHNFADLGDGTHICSDCGFKEAHSLNEKCECVCGGIVHNFSDDGTCIVCGFNPAEDEMITKVEPVVDILKCYKNTNGGIESVPMAEVMGGREPSVSFREYILERKKYAADWKYDSDICEWTFVYSNTVKMRCSIIIQGDNVVEVIIDGDIFTHYYDAEGICVEADCKYKCTHEDQRGSAFVDGVCSICNYDCVAKEHIKNTNNWLNKNAAEHEFTCSVCGMVATGNHDFSDQGDETHTCADCGATEYHNFSVEDISVIGAKKSDATCTEKAKYYKSCICGIVSTSDEDVFEVGTALGHTYTLSEKQWAEDGSSCKFVFVCQRDASHVEEVTVTVTSAVKTAATCVAKGTTTYTATCTFEGTEYSDTKDVTDLSALGHSFSKGAAQTKCDRCDFTREVTKEVENLTVTSGVGEAMLTWSAVPGAVKYAVYMKTSAGTMLLNSNVTTNSYKATGLAGGEKIGFTVRPYIDSWGSYSPVVWAMVHTPQTAVVSKVVVATDMNQATVSWSAVSGAREYALYQKNADGTTVLVSNGLTGTTYTVTGLADGARVGFIVRAKIGTTWYGYSTVTWTTLPAPAVPPTGVKAQAGDGCATVTWNAVPGAGRYALYQKSASGAVTLISAEVTGTSYEVTGLTNGETVGFVLKSRTSKGWSTWSATGWTKPQGGR